MLALWESPKGFNDRKDVLQHEYTCLSFLLLVRLLPAEIDIINTTEQLDVPVSHNVVAQKLGLYSLTCSYILASC